VIVLDALFAFLKASVWVGAWSTLIGVPAVWLRVRRTSAWRARPNKERSSDLMVLGDLVLAPAWVGILWAWVVLATLAVGDVETSAAAFIALVWAPPTAIVLLAILRMDAGERVPCALRRISSAGQGSPPPDA
jgi:hypothetical protein